MSKTLYAVYDKTIELFKGNEQAFIHLVSKSSNKQRAVFICENNLNDYIDCCLVYFGEENLEIKDNILVYHQPLFNQTYTLVINKDSVLIEEPLNNPFLEVMIRVHRNWVEIDEIERVFWLGSCQKHIKRVE